MVAVAAMLVVGGGRTRVLEEQPPWCGEFFKVECRAIFEK
jgi:hypothetical protein